MLEVTALPTVLQPQPLALFLMLTVSTKVMLLQLKKCNCQTWIVGKGGFWVTSFIYKYETSTTHPLYETTRHFILINKWPLWGQSTLPTISLYPQSGSDQCKTEPRYFSTLGLPRKRQAPFRRNQSMKASRDHYYKNFFTYLTAPINGS